MTIVSEFRRTFVLRDWFVMKGRKYTIYLFSSSDCENEPPICDRHTTPHTLLNSVGFYLYFFFYYIIFLSFNTPQNNMYLHMNCIIHDQKFVFLCNEKCILKTLFSLIKSLKLKKKYFVNFATVTLYFFRNNFKLYIFNKPLKEIYNLQ